MSEFPLEELRFVDALELGVRGRAFSVEETGSPYRRLPTDVEGRVPGPVWNLGKQAAGLFVDFYSDSPVLAAELTLEAKETGTLQRHDTIDVYGFDEARWGWVGRLKNADDPTNRALITRNLPARRRLYRVYLPYIAQVVSLKIGVEAGACLEAAPLDPQPPIVCYGTSIVQGLHASRSGMTMPAQLGRRLGRTIVNLGFSGNARMDPGLEKAFARLAPQIFCIDCLPNMQPDLVTERTAAFVRTLREAHPEMPILLVENIVYQATYMMRNKRGGWGEKNAALRIEFEKLRGEGVDHLFCLPGENLLGHDGEATTDGVHPSDLGMVRLTDAYESILRSLI